MLALVALSIVGASLWYSSRIVQRVRTEERKKVQLWAEAVKNRAQLVNYTDSLFKRLREEERKKVELWAEAQRRLVGNEPGDLSFYLQVASDNTTIPVIITDKSGRISQHRNLEASMERDTVRMLELVKRMDRTHDPIVIVALRRCETIPALHRFADRHRTAGGDEQPDQQLHQRDGDEHCGRARDLHRQHTHHGDRAQQHRQCGHQ